jgi:hypothetical protein
MTISLYDASVGTYLQIVPALRTLLDKAAEHFEPQGVNLDELIDTRLHADMLPLRYQIVSAAHHALGTIEGLRAGTTSPPAYDASLGYAAMQALLEKTHEGLLALTAEEVNGLSGSDVVFVMGELRLPFTAENYVLSFSLPNFYFHVTTAYDILREKGLPLGKRDFMGKLRITREPKV